MINSVLSTSIEELSSYLQSEEFSSDWMAGGQPMQPSVNLKPKPGGAFLVFGASRIQKDSRRPRFELRDEEGKTSIVQVRTNGALLVLILLCGYSCCLIPGLMVHLKMMASRSYSDKVAALMMGVLKTRFPEAD
jgi:hypothetical protein